MDWSIVPSVPTRLIVSTLIKEFDLTLGVWSTATSGLPIVKKPFHTLIHVNKSESLYK